MTRPRCTVQLPERVFKWLQAERQRMQKAFVDPDLVDQGFPMWLVIERLMDFKSAHRQRRRQSKKKGTDDGQPTPRRTMAGVEEGRGLAGTDGELAGNLAVRWTASGGDSVVRYQSAVRGLVEWRGILRRCTFSTDDCFEFLTRCRDDEGVGIYCDPPFPDAGESYKHAFAYDDHRKLADHLKRFTRARVVCRFYDHPLIRDLYPEDGPWPWRWHHLAGGKTQTNAAAPEVLLCNQGIEF